MDQYRAQREAILKKASHPARSQRPHPTNVQTAPLNREAFVDLIWQGDNQFIQNLCRNAGVAHKFVEHSLVFVRTCKAGSTGGNQWVRGTVTLKYFDSNPPTAHGPSLGAVAVARKYNFFATIAPVSKGDPTHVLWLAPSSDYLKDVTHCVCPLLGDQPKNTSSEVGSIQNSGDSPPLLGLNQPSNLSGNDITKVSKK